MRRLAHLGAAVAVVVAGSGALVVGSARAELVTFAVDAGADGVRTSVEVPGAPLTSQVADTAGPISTAMVNGLGESRALASLPYPGDTPTSLPNLLFPLVGLPTPPPYPLMATSEHPSRPASSVEGPNGSLSARSDADSSEATATAEDDGADGGNGRSSTSAAAVVARDDAVVTAEATSTTESETYAGGAFRVGRVHATAFVRRPLSGTPVVRSSFSAEGVTVGDAGVEVTPEGILVPGAATPVPDTSGQAPALDEAGVFMRYVEPEEVEGGVVSAGLVVTVETPTPSGTRTRTTYTFGRARAVATATAEEGGRPPPPTTTTVTTPESATPPVVPDWTPPAPEQPAAAVAAPVRGAVPASTTRTVDPLTLSAASFYLVLVVAAAVVTAASLAVRLSRVRTTWTS